MNNSNVFAFILGLFFFVFACKSKKEELALPVYNQPDFSPIWLEKGQTQADSIHQIAPFAFEDQSGKTIRNEDLDGKIYVANFMFSICPSICPKMQNNLMAVQKAFAKDQGVQLLSHTVMPWVDSVGQLKRYGEKMGINPAQWHLLTGKTEDIYQLARQSYFAEEEIGYAKGSDEFLHTEHVLLIDGARRIRGVYNGTLQLEIERLVEDIRILKGETQ
jgi:protein SCO1